MRVPRLVAIVLISNSRQPYRNRNRNIAMEVMLVKVRFGAVRIYHQTNALRHRNKSPCILVLSQGAVTWARYLWEKEHAWDVPLDRIYGRLLYFKKQNFCKKITSMAVMLYMRACES